MLAYSGNPKSFGSFANDSKSPTETPRAWAAAAKTNFDLEPSGITTLILTLLSGSSSANIASLGPMLLTKLYLPGPIELACGMSSAAVTNSK